MAALPCLSSRATAPVISRARGPTARPVTTATRSSAGKRPALLAHGSHARRPRPDRHPRRPRREPLDATHSRPAI